ncbi:MAG: class I SAM-dependent methyltransferase [Flavobacteriales bacterium]
MEKHAVTDPATAAFSQQAAAFDQIDADDPIITWMRTVARKEALRHMRPGSALLELNAGTGLDAFHFAAHGICVTATDGAEGMVAAMRSKCTARPELPVHPQLLPFTELHQLSEASFDHVFSNFGGLNCSPDLRSILLQVDRVLRPGGTSTLVIMPRFSPWEVGALVRGNLGVALRRWRAGGTPAQVESMPFPCYYYSVHDVERWLGNGHTCIALRSLSFFVPPPHLVRHYHQWPRSMRILHHLEDRLAHRWPFSHAGDHFLITLQKR